MELRVGGGMGKKISESRWGNEGFQKSWGVIRNATSQILSLKLPSVWGGKSLKFLGKMKVSGCVMYMDLLCIWMCYVNGCAK